MEEVKSIDSLSNIAITTADYFRLGYEGASAKQFVLLIDQLSSFLEQQQCQNHPKLVNFFSIMLKAQETNDHLYLADLIQYELFPLLNHVLAL
jgi:hypothetical protein